MLKRSLFFIIAFTLISYTTVFADQGSTGGTAYMWTSTDISGKQTNFDWVEIGGNTPVISGAWTDPGTVYNETLPVDFDFSYFGSAKTQFWVSTHGWVSFSDPVGDAFEQHFSLPTGANPAPTEFIAPYWSSSLQSTAAGGVYTEIVGTAPFRKAIIQWEVYLNPTGEPLIFQAILYETTNVIKFQYKTVDNVFTNDSNIATIGIQENTSSAEMFHDPNGVALSIPISDSFALLWHGETLTSADAAVTPTTTTVNNLESYTYTINNIVPSATDALGKVDRVAIYSPATNFSSTTVTSVSINGSSAFIQNSSTKPNQRGFATWQRTGDSLIIQTSDFEVINSLVVNFVQYTASASGSPVTLSSTSDARLDNGGLVNNTNPTAITISPEAPQLDYFTITDVSGTTTTAGTALSFNVNAFDESGSPISLSGDQVNLTAIGSATAQFSANPLTFSGGSSESFTVIDTIKGTFSIKAEKAGDASVFGTSALVTVNAAGASTIVKLSSEADIKAGSDRVLQAALEDQYGNRLGAGTTVGFTISSGSGSLSSSSDATDVNGIAEVTLTASTEITATSGVNDIIDISSTGATTVQMSMVVIANNLSYYSFSPSTDQSFTAGGNVAFTVTARDQYGNAVVNSDNIIFSGQGSGTANFTPSSTLNFSGSSSVNVTVSDNTAGSFTVKGVKQGATNIAGTSGLITVNAGTADQFTILSSSADITAGDNRLLRVQLQDQYNNALGSGINVTFTRSSGTGLFSNGLASIIDATDANGIAEATYTASTTSGGTDVIDITSSPATPGQISLNVTAGSLAELRIQKTNAVNGFELADTTLTADGGFTVYAAGYDAAGNFLGLQDAAWSFTGISLGNLTPAVPGTSAVFSANTAGSGSIKITVGSISDITGSVTVTAGATATIAIMDAPNNEGSPITSPSDLAAGSAMNLFANGFDSDGNFSGNVAADWNASPASFNTYLDGGDLTNKSNITFLPEMAGTVDITAALTGNGSINDNTGNFNVTNGSLSKIIIQTDNTDGGQVLNDSSITSVESITAYAVGYDVYNNFLGLVNANWSGSGIIQSANLAPANPTNSVTFTPGVIGTGKLAAVDNASGTISDNSGLITVTAGPAATADYVTSSSVSGQPNSFIQDSLAIIVKDINGNPVQGITVTWATPSNGNLTPGTDVTDELGISRSKWQLKSTTDGDDSATATPTGLAPLTFTATMLQSTADKIDTNILGNNQAPASVGTVLADSFQVKVLDSFDNPVQGESITFVVTNVPQNASGYSLSDTTVLTDANGWARTRFTLGSRPGDYTITANNLSLTNSGIAFNATATAGSASNLVAFSGNNQNGTVNSALAQPLVVQVVDAFGNGVSGQTVSWTPSAGSISGNAATDSEGKDDVTWTLGTASGPQTLTANIAGVGQVVFNATANPGAAVDVLVVSGDNSTTVAGSTQRLKAQVVDAFTNPVPGAQVEFLPINSMSALNTVSNDTGYVTAVYRTPSGQDFSVATVQLAGQPATAKNFTVYGLRYSAGSLSPTAVNTGDTNVAFSITVNNPGPSTINLNTSATIFDVTYNSTTTSTTLSPSTATLNPSATTQLDFDPVTIASDYPSGSYTPEITLVGSGAFSSMNGAIHTNPGELSISPLEITAITIPSSTDTLVTIGSTIRVEMHVTNNSSSAIDNINPLLNISPSLVAGSVTALGSNPTIIPGNTSGIFELDVNVGTAVNSYSIDGSIYAEIQGTSDQVFDLTSDQTAQFRVVELAAVSWQSYSPDTVSTGQSVTFTANVQNNSSYDVFLNRLNTYLRIGTNNYQLTANQSLLANDITTLAFNAGTAPTTTSLQLDLVGTQEGNPFSKSFSSDTLALIPALTIQQPADLTVGTVALSAAQVSQGQDNESFSVQVTNSGEAAAVINSINDVILQVDKFSANNFVNIATLTSDYQSVLTSHTSADFPLTLNGSGGSDTFIFDIDILDGATAVTGSDFRSQVTFTDVNSGSASQRTSGTDSWDVLSKTALSITDITPSVTQISPGSGFTVDVTIENSGQAPASVTALNLRLKRNNLQLTPSTPALPFALDGVGGANSSQIVNYTVNIPTDAVTGEDSIGVFGTGNNQLSSENIAVPLQYTNTVNVLGAPTISVLSVNAGRDTVSTGQQNIAVTVAVSNPNDAEFLLDSLILNINRGEYDTADTIFTTPHSIPAGQTADIEVLVDIAAGSPAGIATINAAAYGTVTGAPVSDTTAITTDSWLIQTAVNITAISDFSPSVVSTNQNLSFVVTVQNSGQADLVIDRNATILYPQSLLADSVKLAATGNPTRIEGNQTAQLTFEATSFTTPVTAQLLEMQLFGTDNGQNFSNTITSNDNFTVETQAAINILSTTAVEDSVTQGQVVQVTINVQNSGQAGLSVESLSLNNVAQTELSPALPYPIAGGDTVPFEATYTVPGTSAGDVNLNASGTGRDVNSNTLTSDFAIPIGSRHSWFVATPPNVDVSVLTSSFGTIAQGQDSIPVDVTLTNSGGTPVLVTSISIIADIGTYTRNWELPFNFELRDQPVTRRVYLDVGPNSATGADVLSAQVGYTNIYHPAISGTITGSDTHTWTITGTSSSFVSIVSVQTDKSFITQGQGPETVNVLIQNDGETNITIDSLQILFDSGTANSGYTIGTLNPVLPRTINAGGGSQNFQIPVTVNAGAAVGTDEMTARVVYSRLNEQMPPKTNPNVKDSWTIQEPPQITIDSLIVNPQTVSTGQQNITASVYVSNAENANGATARITAIDLNSTGITDIDPSTVPSIPLTLPPGTNSRFDFTFNAGTASGVFSFDPTVTVVDINNGNSLSVPDPLTADELTIQDAADLQITNISVSPGTVSQGQTHGRIYVDITNNGTASAQITSKSISNSGSYNLQQVYIEPPQTPFTLTGGEDRRLTFSFVGPDNPDNPGPENIQVDAAISGIDLNSGFPLSALSTSPASLTIETPAEPGIEADDRLIVVATSDTTIQFNLNVTNTGEADIILDNDTKLIITRDDVTYRTIDLLSVPQTINGLGVSQLQFAQQLIGGLTPNTYDFELVIDGTTNGADYTNIIGAGTLVFGAGQVVIDDIFVSNGPYLQGATNFVVSMRIANTTGTPIAIDPFPETTLNFSGAPFVNNLTRTDNFTQVSEIPRVLTFTFDIPIESPTGILSITGIASLNGGALIIDTEEPETITVQSAAQPAYIPASLFPTAVVNQQNVNFKLKFRNEGSAPVNINASGSYITIPDISTTTQYPLSGDFTLPGSGMTELTFNSFVPSGLGTDSYDVRFHLQGSMLNEQTVSKDSTITNAFQVVQRATLQFSNIEIIPEQVYKGQKNIQVNYTIENTGGSDATVSRMDHIFQQGGGPVSSSWLNTTQNLFPFNVTAGDDTTISVFYNLALDANTGIVSPAPTVYYRDIKIPEMPAPFQSNTIAPGGDDQVEIIEPATVRIDSLYADIATVPNKPFINQGQNFTLAVRVSNNGDVTITDGTIVLNFGTSTLTRQINSLSPGASVVRTFTNLNRNTTTLFTANLENVTDTDANQVVIGQPLDNSENIVVQIPRTLSIANASISSPASVADDGKAALGQQFTVSATVAPSGESSYGSGSLKLVKPAGYVIVQKDTVFNAQDLNVFWTLNPTQLTASGSDVLRVQFANAPNDLNTELPVAIGSPNDVPINIITEEIGNVNISRIAKSTTPDSVSTGQLFVIEADISINQTVQNATATLLLPAQQNYAVVDASTKPVPSNTTTTVTWQVAAPVILPSTTLGSFRVRVNGYDTNLNQEIDPKFSSVLQIRMIKRATLDLVSEIFAPDGAKDRIVSTQQKITLRTRVINSGADFDSSGVIQLKTSREDMTFDESGINTLTVEKFSTDVIDKIVTLPAGTGTGYIEAVLTNFPKDKLSNTDATVKIDSVRQNLQIQKRAELLIRMDTSFVDNEGILQRGTNQTFNIYAFVNNLGVAGVDTSAGRHIATLDTTGSGLTITDGDSVAERFFSIGDTISWEVKSSSEEQINDPVPVRVYVKPEHQPLDENENLTAFRSVSFSSDTVNFKFNEIEDIELTTSFEQTPQEQDTLIVSVNQDQIGISATVGLDEQLNGIRTATLVLPQSGGYSSVGGNLVQSIDPQLTSKTISWRIKAPSNKSTDVDTLIIRLNAVSEDGLLERSSQSVLYIKTIPKARLALSLSIDRPDGAADGIVSQGQTFRLTGIILNRDTESQVDNADTAQVTITFDPANFRTVDTLGVSADFVQDFTVGSEFHWWVKALSVTPTAANNAAVASFLEYKNSMANTASNTKTSQPAEVQSLDGKQKRAFNALSKAIKDFGRVDAAGSPLTVTISEVPDDAILKTEADLANRNESKNVIVQQAAKIELDTTFVLNDKDEELSYVSTGQVFEYKVSAGEISSNLSSPQAGFILPALLAEGNKIDTVYVPLNEDTKTASLNISVPQTGITNNEAEITVGVFLVGIDINSNRISALSRMKQNTLTVRQRPDIVLNSMILSPASAVQSGVLSFGQELVVKVWADYAENTPVLSYAEIADTGQISLNPALINTSNFILPEGQALEQTFTALGEENALTWRIKAPNTALTANAIFSISTRPVDSNSKLTVASSDPAESYGLTVRQREVVIIPRTDLVTSNSFRQNQSNLRLLAFDISNRGQVDPLKATSLSVKFLNGEGVSDEALDASALAEMFATLKVRKEDYITPTDGDLGKNSNTNEAIDLSSVQIDESSTNPISLSFNLADTLVIDPDTLVTMFVLADFKQNARISSFRTKLEGINVFDVDESIPLKLVTGSGEDFLASSGAVSNNQNILSGDVDKNFFIYPNPFGRGETADLRLGRFNFSIDQMSDVKLSIYTLLGELVITKTRDNLAPGDYSDGFSWDGRNENGNRVLNGTYIAVLEVRSPTGGSVKRHIIKIAYIK